MTHDIWINRNLYSLAWTMEFGDLFYGRSPVMRTKVIENLFRQSFLASSGPSEPSLSTCFLTMFANWVFSAKQEAMLSLANCLFSWNMKINLQMTKRAEQTTSLWSWVVSALTFNRCGPRASVTCVQMWFT
ncbi:rCG36174 [Rattus norvegicus]|uniref:RCG36174 n=1 Tax=Rattus norvegicus TaxID=10116 RepID=A6IJF2_RAT|nr:rCG36174 [Rattus norvegicus]